MIYTLWVHGQNISKTNIEFKVLYINYNVKKTIVFNLKS